MLKSGLKLTVAGIVGGLLSLSFLHFFPYLSNENTSSPIPIEEEVNQEIKNDIKSVNTIPNPNYEKANLDFNEAAEKTVNSVVHIQSTYQTQQTKDPIFEFFYGPQPNQKNEQIATGSGVIISNDGYIVTNNHVIDDADELAVTLNDGRKLNATLIGSDPGTDIALLKIDENNLQFTEFGNSDEVEIGDWVLAVGNPFNLTSTVTAGIVSAKARNINLLTGDRSNNVFPLESFIGPKFWSPGSAFASSTHFISPSKLLVC